MDIDGFLEAFQDFEKKGKKDTCPVLEQFLCHVAKTGQPMILWPQLKTYFMFKLEKVMDDFHASTPEQRGPHNPNVEYVPFEEMKQRILKIVDGYSGIPFTIQRLCELLTDPKRNYTGTDKFLRGLEKNVMVVSCVYPTSEKNGASSINRMNGVMLPGNSFLFSDSRNINGPGTPKPPSRPKLSLSNALSTNGLPDCSISKEPELTTEEVEQHHISDSSLPKDEITPNSGIKNKHPEEDNDYKADKQEIKRLKLDRKEDIETESVEKELSCHEKSESLSKTLETSRHACGQENSATSCDTSAVSEDHEYSSTQTVTSETEGDSTMMDDVASLSIDCSVDQPEQPAPSEDWDNVEINEEGLVRTKLHASSFSGLSDLSTEGDTADSQRTEPGDN
ncbi:serine/threonine-protein phosphatase 4 regulatory subunit 2-A-like isoform X2 [Betta splendens]|uniref:Serine/threonine-protein phosphatase 4 regulatory subunit 2-A-like isoform X2 n=1 Tax=Betta splendens TaxID=158456 RepID=A0A6P7LW01_BETSP|nr:serine/threonine-protein phosphatase 4 regulatory subunit 2-A-like isoform X2 [Betta splendens]